jgi:hypothetical protein
MYLVHMYDTAAAAKALQTDSSYHTWQPLSRCYCLLRCRSKFVKVLLLDELAICNTPFESLAQAVGPEFDVWVVLLDVTRAGCSTRAIALMQTYDRTPYHVDVFHWQLFVVTALQRRLGAEFEPAMRLDEKSLAHKSTCKQTRRATVRADRTYSRKYSTSFELLKHAS